MPTSLEAKAFIHWFALVVALCLTTNCALADTRRIADAQSPAWTRAVGKLSVSGEKRDGPHRTHHIENCSATLVSASAQGHAKHILSAWHCFEYYRDLTAPIIFRISAKDSNVIERRARLTASGGSMEADWALLQLDQPVSNTDVVALQTVTAAVSTDSRIAMGGFSRDLKAADHSTPMSYDTNCKVTTTTRDAIHSNCVAHKGASGGAVVRYINEKAYLAGIISAGDGQGLSLFVPLQRLIAPLRRNRLLCDRCNRAANSEVTRHQPALLPPRQSGESGAASR